MALSAVSPDSANWRLWMLGRSDSAASSLSSQYYLPEKSLHFNLHPSIPIPKDACIADLATRTAVWLTDISEYPTAQLDGFVIKTSQAPCQECLPPNIRLKTWNVSDDVPEQMIGVYDVVHVRLLVSVVQNGDPRSLVRNFLKMLKPGGYIQWDELYCPGAQISTGHSSSNTPALQEMRETLCSRGQHNWTLRLPEFFAEVGLLDTMVYHLEDFPSFARAYGEQHLLKMKDSASSLAETDHREEATEFFILTQNASHQVLNGAALSMPRIVCVGRKGSVDVGRE